MTSEYARAGEGIGETRMQSLSVSRDRLEQVENDLKDTQGKISETLPKLIATREQLQRSQVRAPATGQVVGLQVFTVGGVVAAGQKLMDVVPDGRELLIQAQLSPNDADDAYRGQTAQIRFVSVHNRALPLFTGLVRTVSADSFTDEKTGRSYFRVGSSSRKRNSTGSAMPSVMASCGRGFPSRRCSPCANARRCNICWSRSPERCGGQGTRTDASGSRLGTAAPKRLELTG